MINSLYIIGNGFDRYHGLETRYQAFALYLKRNNYDIYELFIEYFGLSDLDLESPESLNDPLWADFEQALANLDFKTVLDDFSDYSANPASDDFRDRDWHAYEFEMNGIVEMLTNKMVEAFKKFLLAIEFPEDVDDKLLRLEKNALYLSFNYTDTLQRYYGINPNNILYIHGKAKNIGDRLVLGHGFEPSSFEEEETQPEGLNEEELEQWSEYMANKYEYSYASAKSEIMTYFNESHKHTSEIIKQNKIFFDKLDKVNEVFVLGQSMAPVDWPYLKHVSNMVNKRNWFYRLFCINETNWIATYYSDNEKKSHFEKLKRLGVRKSKIKLIKMDELKYKPAKLF